MHTISWSESLERRDHSEDIGASLNGKKNIKINIGETGL
jgi:hypothetical protein